MSKIGKSLGLLFAGALVVGAGQASAAETFFAHMDSSENVPANSSKAQSQLILQYTDEGNLNFKLMLSNIDEFSVSHIHCAPAGLNGPAGVNLAALTPPSAVNGTIEGVITVPNGNGVNNCGWVTNADVVAAIKAGNAYVNVHTKSVPGGVIRGQLR